MMQEHARIPPNYSGTLWVLFLVFLGALLGRIISDLTSTQKTGDIL
jgi:hypothetical protein